VRQFIVFILAAVHGLLAVADEARIAVAANFIAPMQQIAAAFERASGHRAKLSFGSSGKLYAQIVNGAPYDLFLSADSAKPRALVADGLAQADSLFTYAVGALVLWRGDGGDARAALLAGDYDKLAIPNPQLAPYGAAAVQTLEKLGLAAKAGPHLVTGENIAQAHQYVSSGNAQLGFVALSQVAVEGRPPAGAWLVPADLHAPIKQDAVLLTRGAANPAARAMLEFLHGDQARAIIRGFGYRDSDQTAPR
jgi:molybdate transport system substrate-binding protein